MRFQVGDIVRVKKDHKCNATDNGYKTAHDYFGDGVVNRIVNGNVHVDWSNDDRYGTWTPSVLRLDKRP